MAGVLSIAQVAEDRYGHAPQLPIKLRRSSMSMTAFPSVSPMHEAGQSSQDALSPSQVPPSVAQSSLVLAAHPELTQHAPVGPVSLALVKRKPFDILAEGPFSGESRGDRI